jgi:hypothetical protein
VSTLSCVSCCVDAISWMNLVYCPAFSSTAVTFSAAATLGFPASWAGAVPWFGAVGNVAASTTASRMRTLLDDAIAGVVLDRGAGWVA